MNFFDQFSEAITRAADAVAEAEKNGVFVGRKALLDGDTEVHVQSIGSHGATVILASGKEVECWVRRLSKLEVEDGTNENGS